MATLQNGSELVSNRNLVVPSAATAIDLRAQSLDTVSIDNGIARSVLLPAIGSEFAPDGFEIVIVVTTAAAVVITLTPFGTDAVNSVAAPNVALLPGGIGTVGLRAVKGSLAAGVATNNWAVVRKFP